MINSTHKHFFTQTIQYLILLSIFNYFWGTTLWYQNKLRDTLLAILIYFVFLIIGWFSFLFRPVILKIKQTSILGEGIDFTLITLEGKNISSLLQRSVKMKIELTKKGSVWWRLLLLILRKKEVYLVVQPVPKDIVLQAKEQFLNPEIKPYGKTGFKILLNELLKEVGEVTRKESVVSKTYVYSVADHPQITIPENVSATVTPLLYIGDKPIKWLKILIKIESDEQRVRFFRR